MSINFQRAAEKIIRHSGDRTTVGRVGILAILLGEKQAITHREIEVRLIGKRRLNRVTLYRVLEWLTERGLVHKIISADRVWRFRANEDIHLHQHAHFECTRCTKVICLDDSPARQGWSLPTGYRLQEVELTVKGLCSQCV